MKSIRKDKILLKKVEKTKQELYPDLEAEYNQKMSEIKEIKKQQFKEEKKAKFEEEKSRKEEAELKSYKNIIDGENMKSNNVEKSN